MRRNKDKEGAIFIHPTIHTLFTQPITSIENLFFVPCSAWLCELSKLPILRGSSIVISLCLGQLFHTVCIMRRERLEAGSF